MGCGTTPPPKAVRCSGLLCIVSFEDTRANQAKKSLPPLTVANRQRTFPRVRRTLPQIAGPSRKSPCNCSQQAELTRQQECLSLTGCQRSQVPRQTNQRSSTRFAFDASTLVLSWRRCRPLEQLLKATSGHVKATRLVLGRPKSSSLPFPIFRTIHLAGIRGGENHKTGSRGFEEFLRKAGRQARTRRRRGTNRRVCLLTQATDSSRQEKRCLPARTFPHSNALSSSLIHRSERVRRP